jgi:hypothetical protein
MNETRKTSIQLVFGVPTFNEHFDYSDVFKDLVQRHRGKYIGGSFSITGNPRSFTFTCILPKSRVRRFTTEWRQQTRDLSIDQQNRLAPAIVRAFRQLRRDLGDDDFSLLARTFKRRLTVAWLATCFENTAPAPPLSGHTVPLEDRPEKRRKSGRRSKT